MNDVIVDQNALPLISAAVAHKYLILPVGKTPDGTLKIIVSAWNARVMDIAHKIASQPIACGSRLPLRPKGRSAPAIEQWYGPPPRAGAHVEAPRALAAVRQPDFGPGRSREWAQHRSGDCFCQSRPPRQVMPRRTSALRKFLPAHCRTASQPSPRTARLTRWKRWAWISRW